MFGRGVLFLVVLAVACCLPYYLSQQPTAPQPGQPPRVASWWDSMWSSSVDDRLPVPSASPVPGRSAYRAQPQWGSYQRPAGQQPPGTTPGYPSAAPSGQVVATPWVPVQPGRPPAGPYGSPGAVAAAPPIDLARLVRFDVTPGFVMQHWQRVSTEIWDGDLSGLRVPLISGTQAHDLAGSLTYYFDKQQILQRVAFQGTTGDPRRIQALASQFGLEPQAAYGGLLFTKKSRRQTTDLIRVRPTTVSTSSSPFQRYEVAFELNRPGSNRSISSPAQQLLDAASSLPKLSLPE